MTQMEHFSLPVQRNAPETIERWANKLANYFPGSSMQIGSGDSQSSFDVTTLGGAPFCRVHSNAQRIQHAPVPGPQSEYVSVLLQLEGHCKLYQRRRECSLQAGEMVVLDMTQMMEIADQNQCTQLFVCLPRQHLASLPLHDGCMRPMSVEDPLHRPLFEMVSHFWHHRTLLHPQQEAHAVQTLLGLTSMASVFQTKSKPSYDVRTQRAIAFIENHLSDPDLNAKAIAASQNVSRRYLDQLFCSTGFRVAGWLWERRLQRAAAALQTTDLNNTILHIALDHGFRSAAHFSRRFHQRFGTTPRQWRDKAKTQLHLEPSKQQERAGPET